MSGLTEHEAAIMYKANELVRLFTDDGDWPYEVYGNANHINVMRNGRAYLVTVKPRPEYDS